MNVSRRSMLAGATALSALPLSGLVAQERRTLSIVTGGTGGVYYPLGGGLANMLAKHVPGWQATSEVTGGSVDNLRLIGARRADIGFTMADASLDAARGEDKFKGSPVPNRALAVLYPNRMHVVTIEGTGINSMRAPMLPCPATKRPPCGRVCARQSAGATSAVKAARESRLQAGKQRTDAPGDARRFLEVSGLKTNRSVSVVMRRRAKRMSPAGWPVARRLAKAASWISCIVTGKLFPGQKSHLDPSRAAVANFSGFLCRRGLSGHRPASHSASGAASAAMPL